MRLFGMTLEFSSKQFFCQTSQFQNSMELQNSGTVVHFFLGVLEHLFCSSRNICYEPRHGVGVKLPTTATLYTEKRFVLSFPSSSTHASYPTLLPRRPPFPPPPPAAHHPRPRDLLLRSPHLAATAGGGPILPGHATPPSLPRISPPPPPGGPSSPPMPPCPPLPASRRRRRWLDRARARLPGGSPDRSLIRPAVLGWRAIGRVVERARAVR